MTGWGRHAWWGVWFIGVAFGGAQRGSWQAVAALVVGALVGAAWQGAARRDVAERLTWLAGFALVFGFAFLLDAVIGTGTSGPEAGPTAYFVAVAAAVVITERVLRRRDLGPVTLDLVHAPDEVDGAEGHHRGGRRAGAAGPGRVGLSRRRRHHRRARSWRRRRTTRRRHRCGRSG